MSTLPTSADLDLAAAIQEYYDDMLGAALFIYPWGKAGTPLATMKGPSREQARFLDDLSDEIKARAFDGVHPVESIEMAVTSGHGSGKTEMIGMLAGVLISTRDAMRGTVTANSGDQLRNKTWASIQKYKKLMVNADWFEITSEKFWRIGRKEDWGFSAVTWKEENADAFQGQHAAQSSSIYIFDEDSNIADSIHTAAEGGTVHGESMIFRFGNCTRRTGNFYQRCFGTTKAALIRKTKGKTKDTDHPASLRRWDTSKTEIRNDIRVREIIEEHGEDSDYYRIRVAGLPPSVDYDQFIGADLIEAAQSLKRIAAYTSTDALIAGCDLSWGGDDKCCVRFRHGMDARTIPPVYVEGAATRDPNTMVKVLAEILSKTYHGRKVDMLFIDSAGIAGPVVRTLRELGFTNIIEVNFGAHSSDPKYKLMRSYMWGQVKEALGNGLALDNSAALAEDLQAPNYSYTSKSEILLEPKQHLREPERLGRSTDDADALCLTFAMPVTTQELKDSENQRKRRPVMPRQYGAWS